MIKAAKLIKMGEIRGEATESIRKLIVEIQDQINATVSEIGDVARMLEQSAEITGNVRGTFEDGRFRGGNGQTQSCSVWWIAGICGGEGKYYGFL